jgi:hypothetical protein
VESGADVHARCRVRTREIGQSLELAAQALRFAEADEPCPAAQEVEGPRGPLAVDGGRPLARGADAARAAAETAAIGAEWASALVAIASFDLSPWRVDS